jgi:hypothetical protein
MRWLGAVTGARGGCNGGSGTADRRVAASLPIPTHPQIIRVEVQRSRNGFQRHSSVAHIRNEIELPFVRLPVQGLSPNRCRCQQPSWNENIERR